VLLLLVSCHEEETKDVLVKPESLPLKSLGNTIEKRGSTNNGYEISVWINGDCLPCILEMGNWHSIYHRFALPYDIRMNFYVYSQFDYTLFEETMKNTLFSALPVYYDTNNSFIKGNNFEMGKADCFFTKNDTILLRGNLVRDRKLYSVFADKVKKLEKVYDISFFDFK
jgi:hypothetical protein